MRRLGLIGTRIENPNIEAWPYWHAFRLGLIAKHQCNLNLAFRNCKKQLQNASTSYAKNSAICVKFICKKQCKMREINMKKQCEMRQLYVQKKTLRNASIFCKFSCEICGVSCISFRKNLAHFSVFFAGKFAENCLAIFYIFQAFS